MPPDRILSFGPYRLDAVNARLWCETQPVRLTAKALQVLSYLAERPGQLVTKDELFGAVWPDTVVSDATLASNIQAVRQALSDDPRNPRFIETVHRQGFRFLGVVVSSKEGVRSQQSGVNPEEQPDNEEPVSSVMPAPAGIQVAQPEALSESPWIPASAGMTPFPFSPQNDVHGEQELERSLDEAQRNSGEASEIAATRLPLRSLRTTGLVAMSLGLLISIVIAVQYFSRSVSNPQPPTPNPQPPIPPIAG